MLDSMMVGRSIQTSDGTEIGQVKEIEGRFFKVDAPMQPDYWLPEGCVESIDTRVHLNIEHHLIGEYILAGPHERGVDRDRNLVDDRDRHEGAA
jgi:hypothetical protein